MGAGGDELGAGEEFAKGRGGAVAEDTGFGVAVDGGDGVADGRFPETAGEFYFGKFGHLRSRSYRLSDLVIRGDIGSGNWRVRQAEYPSGVCGIPSGGVGAGGE